jgi:hypothetical protein
VSAWDYGYVRFRCPRCGEILQSAPSSSQGNLPVTQKCKGKIVGDYILCGQEFQIETISDKCYVTTVPEGESVRGVLGPPRVK